MGFFIFGSELFYNRNLPLFQRIYIRIFGAPEIGAKIRWNIVRKIIRSVSFSSCLDAGCGKAYMLFALARRHTGRRFIGYDLNRDDIDQGTRTAGILGLDNLEFVQGDILEMRMSEKFDLVLSVDNLEHIEEDLKALGQIAGVMKPDSKLLIHVPKPEKKFLFQSSHNYTLEDHARDGYTVAELTRKLKQAGFRVEYSGERYNFFQTLANELGTKAAGFLPLYALLLPFIYLISLVPDPVSDMVRPVRNSIVLLAGLE